MDFSALGVILGLMILSAIWGAVFGTWFISWKVNRGELPKGLKDKKDKLLILLNEDKRG